MMRVLRILASMIVVAVSCGLSFSQVLSEVKVHVLDYRTGHPAKGWKIGLLIGNSWIAGETAKDGLALFHLSEPIPQTLSIDPEAGGWSQWSCSDKGIFQTSEVLQHGVVTGFLQHPLCQHHTPLHPAPHAGEIVIYIRHLNPWLTFRRVLWETFYG